MGRNPSLPPPLPPSFLENFADTCPGPELSWALGSYKGARAGPSPGPAASGRALACVGSSVLGPHCGRVPDPETTWHRPWTHHPGAPGWGRSISWSRETLGGLPGGGRQELAVAEAAGFLTDRRKRPCNGQGQLWLCTRCARWGPDPVIRELRELSVVGRETRSTVHSGTGCL